MTVIHKRSEWGARAAKYVSALVPSKVKYIAIHWPGSVGKLPVEQIVKQLQGWQDWHMDGRKWSDIAYNEAVDQNGEVWTLRGDNKDGSVKNMGGEVYSILAVYGSLDTMSDAMKRTIKERVAVAQKKYPNAKVVGHRELRSTDCPGDVAYKWLKAGMPVDTVPVPPSDVKKTKIRLFEFNTLDERFGPEFDKRLKSIVATIKSCKADAGFLNECPEDARDKIRAMLGDDYLVWVNGTQALIWKKSVLEHFSLAEVVTPDWGSYHGAVVAHFKHAVTGQIFVLGSYHLKPNSISDDGEQQRELRELFTEMRKFKGFRIIGGDGADSDSWLPGWTDVRVAAKSSSTRTTPTYKNAITDRIHIDDSNDEAFVVKGYNVKKGGGSDHKAIVAEIEVTSK